MGEIFCMGAIGFKKYPGYYYGVGRMYIHTYMLKYNTKGSHHYMILFS